MNGSSRFPAGRVALLLLIVVAVFIGQGNQKIPTGPAAGDLLAGPPASRPSGNLLRVATFNIDGGVGKADGRLDLDRTAAAIRGYDLVGLEEVHSNDQIQTLSQKLAMPGLFAPVERQWWHESFGNGVLTSLDLDHWQRIPLSNPNADSNPNLLLLRLQFAGKPLNVIITHLERHVDRQTELRSVVSLFESLQEPAILMGDLNCGKDEAQIATLRNTPGVTDAIGKALNDKTPDSVDWIFARGLGVVRSGFIDNGASDHPVAWAELSVP